MADPQYFFRGQYALPVAQQLYQTQAAQTLAAQGQAANKKLASDEQAARSELQKQDWMARAAEAVKARELAKELEASRRAGALEMSDEAFANAMALADEQARRTQEAAHEQWDRLDKKDQEHITRSTALYNHIGAQADDLEKQAQALESFTPEEQNAQVEQALRAAGADPKKVAAIRQKAATAKVPLVDFIGEIDGAQAALDKIQQYAMAVRGPEIKQRREAINDYRTNQRAIVQFVDPSKLPPRPELLQGPPLPQAPGQTLPLPPAGAKSATPTTGTTRSWEAGEAVPVAAGGALRGLTGAAAATTVAKVLGMLPVKPGPLKVAQVLASIPAYRYGSSAAQEAIDYLDPEAQAMAARYPWTAGLTETATGAAGMAPFLDRAINPLRRWSAPAFQRVANWAYGSPQGVKPSFLAPVPAPAAPIPASNPLGVNPFVRPAIPPAAPVTPQPVNPFLSRSPAPVGLQGSVPPSAFFRAGPNWVSNPNYAAGQNLGVGPNAFQRMGPSPGSSVPANAGPMFLPAPRPVLALPAPAPVPIQPQQQQRIFELLQSRAAPGPGPAPYISDAELEAAIRRELGL